MDEHLLNHAFNGLNLNSNNQNQNQSGSSNSSTPKSSTSFYSNASGRGSFPDQFQRNSNVIGVSFNGSNHPSSTNPSDNSANLHCRPAWSFPEFQMNSNIGLNSNRDDRPAGPSCSSSTSLYERLYSRPGLHFSELEMNRNSIGFNPNGNNQPGPSYPSPTRSFTNSYSGPVAFSEFQTSSDGFDLNNSSGLLPTDHLSTSLLSYAPNTSIRPNDSVHPGFSIYPSSTNSTSLHRNTSSPDNFPAWIDSNDVFGLNNNQRSIASNPPFVGNPTTRRTQHPSRIFHVLGNTNINPRTTGEFRPSSSTFNIKAQTEDFLRYSFTGEKKDVEQDHKVKRGLHGALGKLLEEYCSHAERMRVVIGSTNSIVGFHEMCCHKDGSVGIEMLIQSVTRPADIAVLLSAMNHRLKVKIMNKHGAGVVQACLGRFTKEQNLQILQTVANCFSELSKDKNGCYVVQRCLDHAYEPLFQQIINNLHELCDDACGNYVVQRAIGTKTNPSYDIIDILSGSFSHLATGEFGSHVFEKCVEVADPQRLYMIASELHDDHNLISKVMNNQYGNYVIQKILLQALKRDRASYQLLASVVAQNQENLENDMHGRHIVSMMTKIWRSEN